MVLVGTYDEESVELVFTDVFEMVAHAIILHPYGSISACRTTCG